MIGTMRNTERAAQVGNETHRGYIRSTFLLRVITQKSILDIRHGCKFSEL